MSASVWESERHIFFTFQFNISPAVPAQEPHSGPSLQFTSGHPTSHDVHPPVGPSADPWLSSCEASGRRNGRALRWSQQRDIAIAHRRAGRLPQLMVASLTPPTAPRAARGNNKPGQVQPTH